MAGDVLGAPAQPDTAAAMAQLPINVERALRGPGRGGLKLLNAFLLSQ